MYIQIDAFLNLYPKFVIRPENIDAVRELLRKDGYVIQREIEGPFNINVTNNNKK